MILRGNVFSTCLEKDTGIAVVIPNQFDMDRPYKVAYLLHGISGNHESWIDYTMLPVFSSRHDIVFVMPDVQRSFYANMRYGFDYYDYMTGELPGIVKSVFNISRKREDTFIIGGSMGGYGALKCALTKPELYACAVALSSGCLFLKDGLDYQKIHEHEPGFIRQTGPKIIRDMHSVFGDDLALGENDDLLTVARRNKNLDMPRFIAICGSQDPFLEDNRRFSKEMTGIGYDYTYEEMEGFHDWYFFNDALKRALDIM